jgi:hypothetical protein
MLSQAHVLALVCLLQVSGSRPAHGTPVLPDTSALQFLGFRAGARLDELAVHLRKLGGQMHCRRSKVDPRVHECRAVLDDQELGRTLNLWISAMDSLAGVMTLSGAVVPGQLARWRETLEAQYGRVGPRVQGTQWMLQWVRRGRMLRLTWRLERGEKVASVSLVDGHVLDRWGRSRSRSDSAILPHPASRTK